MIRSRVFSAYLGSEVYPTPDGKSLLVMRDQRYHMYDARTGAYRCVLPGKAGENSFTSFSPDSNLFAAISDAGEAIVWNLQTAQVIETRVAGADRQPPTEPGPLVYQRFSLGDADQNILAWAWVDAGSGQRSWIRNRCDVYRSLPTDCPGAISADGKRILVLQPDRSFAIYDLSSQTVLNTLNLSSNNFAFTPDGRSVVSLRFLDWGVEIWDVQSGKLLERINRGLEGEGPILDIQEFSFSGDGEKLVTVLPYWGDSVRVWNTRTWQLERSLSTSSTVWDAKISGNGELISALSGYVLYLWQEEAQ